jgi:hypothetical protein
MLSSCMLCARNFIRIMWMGVGWIGVPVVARLGYDENNWPLGIRTFREVWHCVFLPRTPIFSSSFGAWCWYVRKVFMRAIILLFLCLLSPSYGMVRYTQQASFFSAHRMIVSRTQHNKFLLLRYSIRIITSSSCHPFRPDPASFNVRTLTRNKSHPRGD